MNDIKVDPFKNNDVLQGKINAHGQKVEYKGRKYEPWDSKHGPHSKFYGLIAKLFTSIVGLFENYDRLLLGVDKKSKRLKDYVKGVDLKIEIDACIRNLNDVSKELKIKEKELIKYSELLKKDENAHLFEEHYPVVKDLRTEIEGLKEKWNQSKKYLARLHRKLEGTFFENSTALIRLKRSEHKFDQSLDHITKSTQKYAKAWKDFDERAADTEEARKAYDKAVAYEREHSWAAFDKLGDQLALLPSSDLDEGEHKKIREDLEKIEQGLNHLRELAEKNRNWGAEGSESEGMSEKGIALKLEKAIPIVRLFVEWHEMSLGEHRDILMSKIRMDNFMFETANLKNNLFISDSTDEEIRKPLDVIKQLLKTEILEMHKAINGANLSTMEKNNRKENLKKLLNI